MPRTFSFDSGVAVKVTTGPSMRGRLKVTITCDAVSPCRMTIAALGAIASNPYDFQREAS